MYFLILVHFCLQIAWLCMHNRFAWTFICCLHFYLSYYFCFWPCNCQISNAIFCVVVFWHFSDCVHMCAHDCLCACLVDSFAFWHYTYIFLFALFFCRGFLICFIVFFGKLIIFECFNYFAGFVGVVVPIWADNLLQNSVLVAFRDSNVHNSGQGTSFCEVSVFFVAFFFCISFDWFF